MPFDPSLGYRVHHQVALRPEKFGALAYHYGNRRLVFLKSSALVRLLDQLADHESAEQAIAAVTKAPETRKTFVRALTDLETSGIICAR